jgi:hypothetical protein
VRFFTLRVHERTDLGLGFLFRALNTHCEMWLRLRFFTSLGDNSARFIDVS